MTNNFSAEQLKQNVQHDLKTCESLLAILQQEQEALKKRDLDQVSAIIDQKVPMLERLDASAKLRQTWATTSNQSNDDEGWANIIAELGGSDIKQAWQRLKALYTDVRNQNEINGKLLSRHQGTVSRVLDIMRGKTAGPNLYTAAGQSSSRAQSNTFGEA